LDAPTALSDLHDLDGNPLGEVLAAARIDPSDAACRFAPERVACFLEAHVDQGSTLSETDAVGIVSAIAGCIRTRLTWHGEASHSGAQARPERRNALLGASRFIAAADDLWASREERGDLVTITVGWLENDPNAPSSVAGRTSVVLDLRAPDGDVLAATQIELLGIAEHVAAWGGLRLEVEELGRIEPVAMHPALVISLQGVARREGIEARLMPSLGGHDAEIIGQIVPTAMVFVANPAGVSHSPDEAISEQSLAEAVAMLDHVATDVLASHHPTPRSW
jgi:hydantoinase/carbamoylase family amidase